jgi:hypothetical protein
MGNLGLMLTPMMGNNPDLSRIWWAADTGCFSQPAKHDNDYYLDWLDKKPRQTCLFATAPDKVADMEATYELAMPMLRELRELGFNACLVAQDGIEHSRIPWQSFDALFMGGSLPWKLGPVCYEIGIEAKLRGKYLHWGRVNSLRRLFRARKARADSADGTYVAYAPDLLLPRMQRWAAMVSAQRVLL